ncbi:MAG: diguanylate cyclase [Campylobacterota bacterium]|nr:diguanylate cyclase [Campylobacterota bacterium]
MFFGSSKLKEEIKEKDVQISSLQLAIQELNAESKKKLESRLKELKKSNLKLDSKTKEIEELSTELDYKTKELRDVNDELEKMTSSDALTGAYNKRYFYDVAESIISLAKREKQPLSLAVIDIDEFKKISSLHGHNIGNQILQTLVHELAYHIRESDLFVKFNEEEFIILFPNTSLKQALIISEKLRQKVESCSGVNNIKFTVSIGISEFIESKDNIETTLKRANEALCTAKESGKNSINSISLKVKID